MEVTITTRQEVQIKRKITLTEEEYHTLRASKNGVPVSVMGKDSEKKGLFNKLTITSDSSAVLELGKPSSTVHVVEIMEHR